MKRHNIKRDYLWNTIGVFLQNALSPLLLIVVTRQNGIYDSGLFSFAFSLALIFWAISMWGGRTFQVSDTKPEFSTRGYIAVRFILAIVVFIGAFVFAIVNQYDTQKTQLIMALVGLKIIESIADVLYAIIQKHNRLYITGISLTIKAVLGILAFIVVDLYTSNVLLSCIALLAVNIFVLMFYDLFQVKKVEDIAGKTKGVFLEALRIMKRCAPIFAMTLLAMFSLNIPRYFLDMYHQEEIGYFGIIAMPITLIVLVMSFILQPNVLQLSHLYEKKQSKQFGGIVRNIFIATGIIGLLILIATYFIGVPALDFIFGIEFAQYQTALMIIVLGATLNALVAIIMNVLVITRHIKAQFYILLFTSIALAFASFATVQEFGIVGCAVLFTIVSALQLVLLLSTYARVHRKMKYAEVN